MMKSRHFLEADLIGRDSYELLNFMGLPKSASRKAQIEALQKDQSWLRDHTESICQRIDELIQSIELGK